jgi:hypothetical protein
MTEKIDADKDAYNGAVSGIFFAERRQKKLNEAMAAKLSNFQLQFPVEHPIHAVVARTRASNFRTSGANAGFGDDVKAEVDKVNAAIRVAEASVIDADIDRARVEAGNVDTKKKMLVRAGREGAQRQIKLPRAPSPPGVLGFVHV